MLTFGDYVMATVFGTCVGILVYLMLHGLIDATEAVETCRALGGVSNR